MRSIFFVLIPSSKFLRLCRNQQARLWLFVPRCSKTFLPDRRPFFMGFGQLTAFLSVMVLQQFSQPWALSAERYNRDNILSMSLLVCFDCSCERNKALLAVKYAFLWRIHINNCSYRLRFTARRAILKTLCVVPGFWDCGQVVLWCFSKGCCRLIHKRIRRFSFSCNRQ